MPEKERIVVRKKDNKEFVIGKFPERDITPDSAKYFVEERFGGFVGKTRTLRGAKRLIEVA